MSTYTPTKGEQQKYTQPVDGDDPETLLERILAFLQGLADGAAAFPRIAFDWAAVFASTFAVVEACFDTIDRAWWVVGSAATDKLQGSWDRGRTWDSATLGTGVTLTCVATDSSGNGLAIDTVGGAYFGARSAFATLTWTHHTAVTTLNTVAGPDAGKIGLCFDAVHGNWITVYAFSTVSVHADYLHTGFAMTAATIPSSWTSAAGWHDAHVQVNALGDAIASMLVTGGFLLSRSSDGGVTWVDPTTLPTLPAPFLAALGGISRPTYEELLDEWYVVVGSFSGTYETHVLRSTDAGVSWFDTGCVTPNMALVDCEAINGVLVGLDVSGRIFRSVDRGVTWSHVTLNAMGNSPAAENLKLRAGDGQLLEISRDDSHICASTIVGAKGGPAQ